MALLNKIRKDIKKSSYYVWFLGAQECKGLRGSEYIIPVLTSLIQREQSVEPFKITLQVSHKGLKIIQNINAKKPEPKPNKNDVIKHVIPHHAVTCVYQEEDVVACVLLLYNPVTRCPVHVHAYRCDTVETATLLTHQLSTLIERPENQKKLGEIEARLRAKGLLVPSVPRVNVPKRIHSCGSDTTSPPSESSAGSSSGGQERLSHLYDSLAAELKEKLGMSTDTKSAHAPILLPPRDYDTVHRQKGNLTGIELRRCLNENIIGKNKGDLKKKPTNLANRLGRSSGGSSGIGSDHPPSPEQQIHHNNLASDEEPSEDSLFVVPGDDCRSSGQLLDRSSPGEPYRTNHHNHLHQVSNNAQISASREETFFKNPNHWSTPNLNIPVENYRKRNEKGNAFPIGVVAPRRRATEDKRAPEIQEDDSYKKRIPGYKAKQKAEETKAMNEIFRHKMKKAPDGTMKLSPQERFIDAKTKFLMLEKERLKEQEKNLQNLERKRSSQVEPPISPEIIKTRPQWTKDDRVQTNRMGLVRRNSFFEDEPKISQEDEREIRGKSAEPKENLSMKKKLSRSESRGPYYSQERLNIDSDHERGRGYNDQPRALEKMRNYDDKSSRGYEGKQLNVRPKSYHNGREPEKPRAYRGNSRDSPRRKSSRDEYTEETRFVRRSPEILSDDDEEDRWFSSQRYEDSDYRKRYDDHKSPARRDLDISDAVPFQRESSKHEALENEKRVHSNALAKEFKRRNYQGQMDQREPISRRSYSERERYQMEEMYDGGNEYPKKEEVRRQDRRSRGYSLDEEGDSRRPPWGYSHHRYHENDRYGEKWKQREESDSIPVDKLPARYRHSFVDQGGMSRGHDMLQRTNSSVSSTRVGIAAIHPY